MKSIVASLAAAALALTVMSAAIAAPAAKPMAKMTAHKMAKTMTCPACKMAMPMKKSAATPVAVPVKGATYYCCADCAAGKKMSAMHKAKAAKAAPAAKKSM